LATASQSALTRIRPAGSTQSGRDKLRLGPPARWAGFSAAILAADALPQEPADVSAASLAADQ
jgi:hypothetical protein